MNVREWALPVYTILMELATGALFIIWIVRAVAARQYDRERIGYALLNPLLVIFLTAGVAMLGAHFHLSKPYLSFLALLNIRNSWLSREILFNLLFVLMAGWLLYLQLWGSSRWQLKTLVGWLTVCFGWATVYSMSRIYLLPTQAIWNNEFTVISFVCTTLLLGFMAMASLMVMDLNYSEERNLPVVDIQRPLLERYLPWFAVGALLMVAVLISENIYQIFALDRSDNKTAQMSMMLLTKLYPLLFAMRLIFITLGASGLALAIYWQRSRRAPLSALLVPAYMTCLLVMIGEILGRFLFYATHVRIGI